MHPYPPVGEHVGDGLLPRDRRLPAQQPPGQRRIAHGNGDIGRAQTTSACTPAASISAVSTSPTRRGWPDAKFITVPGASASAWAKHSA